MKYPSIIASSALLLAACQTAQNPNTFTLDGQINGLEGEQIIFQYGDYENHTVDTLTIVGGKFQVQGEVAHPTSAAILYGDQRDREHFRYTSFWINAGQLTLTIDTADWQAPVVTGSIEQTHAEALTQLYADLRLQMDSLYEARSANHDDQEAYMAIDVQLEALQQEIRDREVTFLREHPDSYAAAAQMRMLVSSLTLEQNKELYANFSEPIRQSGILDEVKREIEATEAVQPGRDAPVIKGRSIYEGQDSISVADFRGKVLLLDFWASWCVPCRASMPHVLACYNQYKDKGFEVMCVADNDNRPADAVQAVEKDGTGAFHHVLRGLEMLTDAEGNFKGYSRDHDLSEAYAVHFLPTKYLIDREGKIVCKVESDEQLDAELARLFAN